MLLRGASFPNATALRGCAVIVDRIYRGWLLTQTAARLLWTDKQLLLFTVLSSICTIVATAIIMAPAYTALHNPSQPYSLPLMRLFILYLVTSFITLFFNTALVALVMERLNGGKLGFEHGLWVAVDNIFTIFVLAAISATVGLIIRVVTFNLFSGNGDRRGGIGALIAVLIFGAAWNIASFLIVPVIVAEGGDPFSVIGRSISLVHKVWGEE